MAPRPAWELGRALVLEFLNLHGGRLEEAVRELERLPAASVAGAGRFELVSEGQGDAGTALFFLKVGASLIALGPGRERPLP